MYNPVQHIKISVNTYYSMFKILLIDTMYNHKLVLLYYTVLYTNLIITLYRKSVNNIVQNIDQFGSLFFT